MARLFAPPDPEITPQDAQELILLRRHYGLGAEDVYGPPGRAIASWEADWLIASLTEIEVDDDAPTGTGGLPDPFAAPVP